MLASLERKRSVILMGAADVGKTAILHEAVQRMIRPQGTHCPEALAGTWVVAVSTGDVLTGTHYLGEWQTRLTELLELIKRGGKVLLYFEDIWALRDAGRASDKAEGFATLIRPYVERGDVQMLGETTPDNFHAASYGARALADDQSLLRNFDVLTVEEPTSEATKMILTQVAKSLRAGGSVRIETSAIERALELSRRFLPYAAFPGKAIRLLEEAAQNGAEQTGKYGEERGGHHDDRARDRVGRGDGSLLQDDGAAREDALRPHRPQAIRDSRVLRGARDRPGGGGRRGRGCRHAGQGRDE